MSLWDGWLDIVH